MDALVGPRTSDALNRAMVGRWYDHYQTPGELVDDKPYHTITLEFLTSGLSMKPRTSANARKSIFKFDDEKDCYFCPAGIMIPFTRIQKRKDEPDLKQYVCNFCSDCVLKKACTKAENRIISRDPREHLLVEMRGKLRTVEGKELYQEQMYTAEPVFVQMKQNRGFREFLLRGKEKVNVEFLMMCIVHNIGKIEGFVKRAGKNLKGILKNGI